MSEDSSSSLSETAQDFESSAQSSSSADPASCEFGIKLAMALSQYNFRNDPEHPDRPIRPTAWRMKVTVVEVNNIDPEIFVYNLGDLDPEEGSQRKLFQSVASPTDLVEYPIGAPLANQSPAFFRLSSIDFVHRSLDALDATWDEIKADVTELIEASARLCELEPQETFTAGTLESDETEDEEEAGSSYDPGSSIGIDCPDDDYTEVEITDSNDPEFPVGTVLSEIAPPAGTCYRKWQVAGAVAGYTMTLTTCLRTHRVWLVIATGGDDATDQVGLSDEYKAVLHYAYSPTQEHSISIAGN